MTTLAKPTGKACSDLSYMDSKLDAEASKPLPGFIHLGSIVTEGSDL